MEVLPVMMMLLTLILVQHLINKNMANKDRNTLYSTIDTKVNTNGVNAITGATLNEVLKDVVDSSVNKTSDSTMIAGNVGSFGEAENYMEGNLLTIQ